jgi:hypothetical protein
VGGPDTTNEPDFVKQYPQIEVFVGHELPENNKYADKENP